MSDKPKSISVDTQYQIVANEYTGALQGSQTVIVINLAISIGILAAMTTMLTTNNYTSIINIVTLSVLSFVGLMGSICCIRTLHISRIQQIHLLKILEDVETEYNVKSIHYPNYYKPLHITLFGFWSFTIIFMIALAICLIELLIPKMFGLLSVTIAFIILALCSLGIIKISDLLYEVVKNKLINQ